jgi:hypothetical protein
VTPATPPAAESLDGVLAVLRAAGRLTGASTVRPLPGGVSSFIAVIDEAGDARVVKASRYKLDVGDEWTADPGRALREAAVLRLLAGDLGPLRVPRVYHVHPAPPVLELEWIPAPAVNWKDELLAGRVDLGVVAALASGMSVLHQVPVPAELADPAGAELFESLRIAPYYRAVAARRPAYEPALTSLIADLARVRPAGLVHGDFTPKNVLVGAGPPVLLDWEVVHAGDPSFDLGMLSAHLLLKGCRRPPVAAGPMLAAARLLAEAYDGPADPALAVRHAGAIILARLWGKSPVGYLPDEPARAAAAAVGRQALLAGYGSLGVLLDELSRADR